MSKRRKKKGLASERVVAAPAAAHELVASYYAGSKPNAGIAASLPAAAAPTEPSDSLVVVPTPADAAADTAVSETEPTPTATPTAPVPVAEPPLVAYTPPSVSGGVRTGGGVHTIQPVDGGRAPAPQRANGNMSKPGQQLPSILPEIPGDLIRELSERNGNAQVFIRFSRRSTTDGKMIILGTAHLATLECLHIDTWLAERAGGGEYFVEIRDLTEQANLLVPKFRVAIEGVPRKFVAGYTMPDGPPGYVIPGAPMGMGGALWGSQPPPQPVPGGYIPQEFQQGGGQMQYPPYGWPPNYGPGLPAGGPIGPVPLSSDRVALQQVNDLKVENDKLRTERDTERGKFETERTRAERDMEALRTKIADLKEELRDARHKADMDLMRAETRAAKNGDGGFDIVKFAAAMAPIATAYMSTTGSRDIEHMKLLAAPKGDNDWMKMLPVLAPLALKFIESRSPAEQAQVMSTMFDAQAQNAALTAQIIQNMAQMSGGESPWVALVQQLIGSGAEAIGKMVDSRQNALMQAPALVHQGRTMPLPSGEPAPQRQPVQAQPQQSDDVVSVPVNQSAYMTVDDEPVDAEIIEETPTNDEAQHVKHVKHGETIVTPPPGTIFDGTPGGMIAKIVYGHGQFPADLKTPEFLAIIRDIHNEKDVEEMGNTILELLIKLDDERNLPPAFLNWSNQPERTFTTLLALLPIAASNKAYAKDLLETLVQFVEEHNTEVAGSAVEAHGEAVPTS